MKILFYMYQLVLKLLAYKTSFVFLKPITVVLCVIFMSCSPEVKNSFSFTGNTSKNPPDYQTPKAQIYLNQTQEFLSLSDLNRGDRVLNLSDRFVFSKNEQITDFSPLSPLNKLTNSDNIKVKASVFCAYNSKNLTQTKDRYFHELGSDIYKWSFSVFELLPKDILLKSESKIIYCSFIFAFRDTQGFYNHYTIAQQVIEPKLFTPVNRLSFIKNTDLNGYTTLDSGFVITKQNLSQIFIVNNTQQIVSQYELFCEGLKIFNSPGRELNVQALFLNLIPLDKSHLPQELKTCRVFSTKQGQVTGMSDVFKIDFFGMQEKPLSTLDIDWSQIKAPNIVRHLEGFHFKQKSLINSFFMFSGKNLSSYYDSIASLGTVLISVNTRCSNNKVFGLNVVLSEVYEFPFRRRFPVMSVTPEEVFGMKLPRRRYNILSNLLDQFEKKKIYDPDKMHEFYKTRKKHKNKCVYKIELRDKRDNTLLKAFDEKNYDITWDKGSYGIEQWISGEIPFLDISREYFEGFKYDSEMVDFENDFVRVLSRENPFLNLRDIMDGWLITNFYFDFMDTAGDAFFEGQGPKVDSIALKCYGAQDTTNKKKAYFESFIDYKDQAFISLRTLFLASNKFLNKFNAENMRAGDHHRWFSIRGPMLVCRLMIYEGEILRYFSKELLIRERSDELESFLLRD